MTILSKIRILFNNIFSKNFEAMPDKSGNNIPNLQTTLIDNKTIIPKIDSIITISKSTIQHLIDWEGKYPKAYIDSGGIATIGIGHAIFDKKEIFNKKVLSSATLTEDEINNLLLQDINIRIKTPQQIKSKIKYPLNQNQFDALVLFAFNQGTIWNVLVNAVNTYLQDKNIEAIKKRWRYHNIDNGKIVAGLINRREGELDLFLGQYKGRNYYNKSKTVNKKLIIGYY